MTRHELFKEAHRIARSKRTLYRGTYREFFAQALRYLHEKVRIDRWHAERDARREAARRAHFAAMSDEALEATIVSEENRDRLPWAALQQLRVLKDEQSRRLAA